MNTRKIGVFENSWWIRACEATGRGMVALPLHSSAGGNPYRADFRQRLALGTRLMARADLEGVDLWVDNGGTGLAFVTGEAGPHAIHLLHERRGAVLASHFVDPLVVAFQNLNWNAQWLSLGSRSWIKLVWDRAQAWEMEKMGVPQVHHLPMAAPDYDYDATPLDPNRAVDRVSFVGSQNTTYFSGDVEIRADRLLPGALAAGVRADLPGVTFYDVYHDLHGLNEPVRPDEDDATKLAKIRQYFVAKLFYNAHLCLRNRDRFVIYLKRRLGDAFELVGRQWDKTYGLNCRPPIPKTDDYFTYLRESAVNLNLVNGNAESGLNMRHFEITAAGGFMLCYDQPELRECFEVGKECDVFRSETELLQKIDYYLSHPDRRVEIAHAGQKRTLSQHLYSHRLARILHLIQEHSPAAPSPT